jgi:flagellar basal-body rod modification protein FlgD
VTDAIGATSSAAASTAPPQSTSALGATLGGDAFLKLLVAQLKYQDPSKPVDSAAFMAQTAQLQMVETLHELVQQNAAVISGQKSLSALALAGQRVTYTANGTTASGVVDSVKLTAGGPTLIVNDTEVPLSAVTEVEPDRTAPSSDLAKD